MAYNRNQYKPKELPSITNYYAKDFTPIISSVFTLAIFLMDNLFIQGFKQNKNTLSKKVCLLNPFPCIKH